MLLIYFVKKNHLRKFGAAVAVTNRVIIKGITRRQSLEGKWKPVVILPSVRWQLTISIVLIIQWPVNPIKWKSFVILPVKIFSPVGTNFYQVDYQVCLVLRFCVLKVRFRTIAKDVLFERTFESLKKKIIYIFSNRRQIVCL